jgi:hypothetical protein
VRGSLKKYYFNAAWGIGGGRPSQHGSYSCALYVSAAVECGRRRMCGLFVLSIGYALMPEGLEKYSDVRSIMLALT